MIVWGWWTRAAQSESTQAPQGAQWVWQEKSRGHRTFPPRTRDEYWVEFGHEESTNPALDTRQD
jgi:hypothetical protein